MGFSKPETIELGCAKVESVRIRLKPAGFSETSSKNRVGNLQKPAEVGVYCVPWRA